MGSKFAFYNLQHNKRKRRGRKITNYRKIRKNVKAISPVISVLMMIAVAVAASLVTYAWVMGYIGGTTNKVGKAIMIQSVSADGQINVQNVGDSTVNLAEVYVNGAQQYSFGDTSLGVGETASQDIGMTFSSNTPYTIKVTTDDGTFSEMTKTFP